jgi:prevent-host-death family protein
MIVPTTMTSREFNQDAGRAKREAARGPVIITDRGEPSHVLLSIAEYRRLTNTGLSLADALADPVGLDIVFDPPRLSGLTKPTDLS